MSHYFERDHVIYHRSYLGFKRSAYRNQLVALQVLVNGVCLEDTWHDSKHVTKCVTGFGGLHYITMLRTDVWTVRHVSAERQPRIEQSCL